MDDKIASRPVIGKPVTCRTIPLGRAGFRRVVTAIAADPRGEFLAAAGDDYKIRILRTSDLKVVRTLVEHGDIVRTLDFDRTGKQLVSAGNDGRLILWNRDASFRFIREVAGSPALAEVTFAPDGGGLAAVGFDSEVFLLGNGEGERISLKCACQDLRAVRYRDDSAVLAVAGRCGTLHLFDSATNECEEHRLHAGRIRDIVFLPSRSIAVCVAEDGFVSVFDTSGVQSPRRFRVTTGKLFAVTVLNSDLIAVAGSDNVIRVIDWQKGQIVRRLEGHTGSVIALDSQSGLLFSGSYDATLRRWSIDDIVAGRQRIAGTGPRVE
ncbi:WD40 repeat domain-containing protein [Rhodopirellula sp.]|nr:WD40 repeat domain-containing protein [Rubripirellula sp.]MDB4423066.1 WD40 repeat domain-containing protein [Rhodopirellula sp.]MDB4624452.1 WD40 repeat domain-containing protein [Rubripirellula sp.]